MGKELVCHHRRAAAAKQAGKQIQIASGRHKQHGQVRQKKDQRASQIFGKHQHQHISSRHHRGFYDRLRLGIPVKHAGCKEHKQDFYKL